MSDGLFFDGLAAASFVIAAFFGGGLLDAATTVFTATLDEGFFYRRATAGQGRGNANEKHEKHSNNS
jgi:hypothetical protein